MGEKGNAETKAAVSLGAAGITSGATGGAATLLNRALTAPVSQKKVPMETLQRLTEIMGFEPDRPFVAPGAPSWEGLPGDRPSKRYGKLPRGWVELPVMDPKGVPLSTAAHEFGHAKGGLIQRVTGALSKMLFIPSRGVRIPKTQTVIGTPAFSPLHVPLMAAAVTAKSDNKAVRWVQEHPAEIAAGMAAVPLLQEAHASGRALNAIRKLPTSAGGGRKGMMKSIKPLAKGFGSHALSHLPAIAALLAASKVRDLIHKRQEGKIEKQASSGNTFLTGGSSMDMDAVFMESFGETLDKIAQGEEEENGNGSALEAMKKKMEGTKKNGNGEKKEEKEEEEEEGQKKEGSLLANVRAGLGLSKEASETSGLRARLGLGGEGAPAEEPAEEGSAFEAWKQTL